jgi:plastocyanin
MLVRKYRAWWGALLVVIAISLAACGGGDDDGGGDTGGGGTTGATAWTGSTGTTGATGGTGATGAPSGETLSLTATEFAFDPAALSGAADTDVTIAITDAGTIEHDFTLDEATVKVATKPGETVTGTVNLPAGTYTFYCSVPGHREAGMEGTLTLS